MQHLCNLCNFCCKNGLEQCKAILDFYLYWIFERILIVVFLTLTFCRFFSALVEALELQNIKQIKISHLSKISNFKMHTGNCDFHLGCIFSWKKIGTFIKQTISDNIADTFPSTTDVSYQDIIKPAKLCLKC